jgi:hypothetical protein
MIDKTQHVIISPHPDDEIISSFEILINNKCSIVYTDVNTSNERREETLKLKNYFDIKMQMFSKQIPPMLIDKKNVIYAPHPETEWHPEHRRIGFEAEKLARDGFDVIFYTTTMTTKFIHEVNDSRKEEFLNKIYPSQKSLWEYEKKYVLFEGRCKWIFK